MRNVKRVLSMVILLCMVLTSLLNLNFSLAHAQNQGDFIKYGDINNDGQVNSTDCVLLRRCLLEILRLDQINAKAADLNGDGLVNSTDYILLRRYILNIIDVFPVEKLNPTPTPTPVILNSPENLRLVSQTSTSATLSWTHSQENSVDIEYVILANGNYAAITKLKTHTIENLVPGQKYDFTVIARQGENSVSKPSNTCTVTTTVSNMEQLKEALIQNFRNLGTDYSVIYNGDVTNLSNEINIALLNAVKEVDKAFMVLDSSFSASGAIGNLKISFKFIYDDKYYKVARTKIELEEILTKELNNRTEKISIVYKDKLSRDQISEILKGITNNDTYLRAAITEVKLERSQSFDITGIRVDATYNTTRQQENFVDKTVDFIISKLVNEDMSQHEKQKLIHDYILNFVDYAEDDKHNDSYSALYYGKTKCNGYAMLTYKMLKAAGIENIIVTNEDHAWNVVNIEGKWYHMDTTWNDEEKKGYGFYGYYNLTDTQIIQGSNILKGRNYTKVDGISCTTNYIDTLTIANDQNDGKYLEILHDLSQNDDYVKINDFKTHPVMGLIYNEVLIKDGEKLGLVDPNLPLERYKDLFHWSTSDSNVVKVSDGVITAIGEGVAVISAQLCMILFLDRLCFV